jgi:hypothetical protein
MARFTSSSLAASDHNSMRNSGGLMKHLSTHLSKQHLTEHKMFKKDRGVHGKDIKIGRTFRHGKNANKHEPDVKSKAISPSIEEFDKMVGAAIKSTGGGKKNKRSMFSRKQVS